jgi:hypothetical protein
MANGFRRRDKAAIGRGNVISINLCLFTENEDGTVDNLTDKVVGAFS